MRRVIAQRGWIIIHVYSDRMSGAKEDRPGLNSLIQAARRGEFEVVVVWRVDALCGLLSSSCSRLQDSKPSELISCRVNRLIANSTSTGTRRDSAWGGGVSAALGSATDDLGQLWRAGVGRVWKARKLSHCACVSAEIFAWSIAR